MFPWYSNQSIDLDSSIYLKGTLFVNRFHATSLVSFYTSWKHQKLNEFMWYSFFVFIFVTLRCTFYLLLLFIFPRMSKYSPRLVLWASELDVLVCVLKMSRIEFQKLLTIKTPTPQNGQTHSLRLQTSAVVKNMFIHNYHLFFW